MSQTILQPGINKGLSNAAYHSETQHLSSSNLKLLLSSPQEFYQQKILGNKPEQQNSSALELGSYVHSLILEPELVAQEYAMFSGWRKQGAEFDAFKEANQGKAIISQPQAHNGQRLAKTVQACPPALDLLKGGEAELSIACELHGVKAKMRADYLNIEQKYIVDVKTTRWPSNPDTFKRTVKDLGYELSAAYYAAIAGTALGGVFDFYWLVISKTDYECQVYKASSQTMAEGTTLVYKALALYKQCLNTSVWPETAENVSQIHTKHEILEI
jgi:hypothetical protein